MMNITPLSNSFNWSDLQVQTAKGKSTLRFKTREHGVIRIISSAQQHPKHEFKNLGYGFRKLSCKHSNDDEIGIIFKKENGLIIKIYCSFKVSGIINILQTTVAIPNLTIDLSEKNLAEIFQDVVKIKNKEQQTERFTFILNKNSASSNPESSASEILMIVV